MTTAHLGALTGTLNLANEGITGLKVGRFRGANRCNELAAEQQSSDVVARLNDNALTGLPANVFDGLTGVTILYLNDNDIAEDGLPDGVFEIAHRSD